MPDITLYTHPVSANSHRVKLLLSLLGLPHAEQIVDVLKGAQRSPEFTALNPLQQLPVLTDGDVVLNESYAILLYLAGRYGDEDADRWWPMAPVDQALVARWMFFTANNLHNGIGLARNEFGFGIPSAGDYALGRGERALGALDRHLAGRDWVELGRPTLADVAVYPFIAVAPEAGFDLTPHRHLTQWVDRLASLPGFVAMPRLLPNRAPRG